jgi:uncharacterized protein
MVGGKGRHGRAESWLQEHGHKGWSSCAVTINGCVRIMSNSAYPNPIPTALIIARLREVTGERGHR